MYIVLKDYLEFLEATERAKPATERRRVPAMGELAAEVGIHPTALSKIANNRIRELSLETGGRIIAAMRRFGFPMQETDLVKYRDEEQVDTPSV